MVMLGKERQKQRMSKANESEAAHSFHWKQITSELYNSFDCQHLLSKLKYVCSNFGNTDMYMHSLKQTLLVNSNQFRIKLKLHINPNGNLLKLSWSG